MNCILSIAGSDSGGGAGIQADIRTISAYGLHACTVITAITAQNTLGVTAAEDVSPGVIQAQMRAVLSDFPISAAKTGMLSCPHTIEAVASILDSHQIGKLVIDPVMVSKSGHRLLSKEAIASLKQRLIPKALLITPNLQEVEELLGTLPRTQQEMGYCAQRLSEFGASAVLVKGGHLQGSVEAVDVLWDGSSLHWFRAPRLAARHTHGTGCTLSAAIAAGLGRGMELVPAVECAKSYLHSAMKFAYGVGAGVGPVNHLWQQTPFAGG